jgi:hypothetical protein
MVYVYAYVGLVYWVRRTNLSIRLTSSNNIPRTARHNTKHNLTSFKDVKMSGGAQSRMVPEKHSSP